MKMNFYEIQIQYSKKYIVAYVQSLRKKNQMYDVMECVYNGVKNVNINTIANKQIYDGLIANHGWYREYKSNKQYVSNMYHCIASK